MNTKTEATQRPWIFYELIGGDYGISPRHDDTRAIATVFESSCSKEDAKLIVNAVNSYDDIVS